MVTYDVQIFGIRTEEGRDEEIARLLSEALRKEGFLASSVKVTERG